MKKFILSAFLLLPQLVFAAAPGASSEADFDSLGGNKVILDRAKALAPDQTVSVVQKREVSRTNRFEIAPEYTGTFGGDTYNRTKTLGLNLNFHITPRWSVGLKYSNAYNTLTPEGERLVREADADFAANPTGPTTGYPKLDYPKSETMALVNWYPFYGKINLMDRAVSQFDIYGIAGYGTVQLRSGNAPTYTAGAGVGFWMMQNFSTRLEMRYQNYTARYFNEDQKMDLTIASVQVGWLL